MKFINFIDIFNIFLNISNNIITNILYVLEKIGLIKYRMTGMKQDNSAFENVKTVYEIEWLTNEVKC